jgi:hypothetical protein
MFEGKHLVLEKGMREAGDVASDEHVVGDNAVHVERAAARVTRYSAWAGGESGFG